jgi:hypothetical protein
MRDVWVVHSVIVICAPGMEPMPGLGVQCGADMELAGMEKLHYKPSNEQ